MTSRNNTQSDSKSKALLIWLAGGVLVIGLIAVVLAGASGQSAGADHPDLQGSVEISGDSLSRYTADEIDPDFGEKVPEISGSDFEGNPVSIEHNGKPKAILFLAHWCQFCQAEVPVVQDWLDQNQVPEGVEFISVATSVDRGRVNFPPSDWLEGEGWSVPVILDSSPQQDVYRAYGAGGFPFWAFVDGDGNLISRASGAGRVDIDEWMTQLQSMA